MLPFPRIAIALGDLRAFVCVALLFPTVRKARMQATELARERDNLNVQIVSTLR